MCSQTSRATSCAAGSMLGSRRSDRALCLGLAARHLGDESEEKLSEICNGEQGQCCVRQDWRGRGQSLGSVLLCLALLQGDAARAEERPWGIWAFLSSSFQLMHLSHLLHLARERGGWGWHGLEGVPGCLCRWVGFSSVLFPPAAALQLLEKDAELSVSSLAAQTMLTLRSPREQPTSGWTLWALCCWPCKGGQK